MNSLTENEKNFIKRAIVATKADLDGLKLDHTKKEDLLLIINTYRSRGYLIPRRADNGKESDLYRVVRGKLGSPLAHPDEIRIEQEVQHVEGIITQLNKVHSKKIDAIERQLELAKKEQQDAVNSIKEQIENEIKAIESKKMDVLKRLEVVKTAEDRLDAYKKQKEKEKAMEEEDGMVKCWECGEWFKAGAGISSHIRNKHPEV